MFSHQQNIANFPHDVPPRCGYALIKNAGQDELNRVLGILGEPIQVTNVMVNHHSKSLVTSSRGLDFHTDHPKADYIAWLCIEPANTGGESILTDAEKAYLDLSSDEQSALAQIHLFEHKVFPDDKDSHPLVSFDKDGTKFYYSYWLVKKNLPQIQKSALDKFRLLLIKHQIPEIKMARGDILVVDNKKIFHGRRAFDGNKRHLRRYWIRKFNSNKEKHHASNQSHH